jgi:uncharacterized protein (TIGR00255 family)
MTGYGRAEISSEDIYGYVEVRSKNHRYRDIKVYLPKKLLSLEIPLMKILTEKISRGKVDLSIQISAYLKSGGTLSLNRELLNEYKKIFDELKDEFGATSRLDIVSAAQLNNLIISLEGENDTDTYFPVIKEAVLNSLIALDEMKNFEGEKLKGDIISFISKIAEMADKVEVKRNDVVGEYQEKIRDKITKFIDETNLDEQRIYQEVAYIIDKTDITEEIQRLRSHVLQFENIIKEAGPIGKKLDFLFQEMNREINTIASKANDFDIASFVVEMKNELEKAREQAQNIE